MSELFPILAGVAIGLVVQKIASPRVRAVVLFVLSALAGATASFISGELFVSWDFLFFDIPLVFAAAVATTLLFSWWRRRAAVAR
jgi:hypothetical protein